MGPSALMTMRTPWMLALTLLAASPAGLANPQPNGGAVPAMYPTKAEAEQAAKQLGCTGAHAMGKQWMPCSSHTPMNGTGHGSH